MQDLKKYFDEEIAPAIAKMENNRKASFIKIILMDLFWLILAIIFSSILPANQFGLFLMVTISSFAVVNYGIVKYLSFKYSSEFNKDVISKVVTFLAPDATYKENEAVPKMAIDVSNFFPDGIADFLGQDYIETYIEDVHLKVSQVSFNIGKEFVHTVKGIFLMMPYEMDDTIDFQIITNKGESKFDKFLTSLKLEKGKIKYTSNEVFNNLYELRTTNSQEEIKSVLTSEMAERILAYSSLCGVPVLYSFRRSYLFILIPSEDELFDATILKKLDYYKFNWWARCLTVAISSVSCLSTKTKKAEEINKELVV